MLTRREFAASLLGVAGAALLAAAPSRADTPSLNDLARRSGRVFGAAMRADQLAAEPALRKAAAAECGMLTPEIHLKWNSIENRKGSIWYEPVDQLVAFAARNGQKVYGHALLWEQSTPDWALRELKARRNWRLVSDHFERVLGRYGETIEVWDVVNEPIDTQGGRQGLRRNTFHRVFGPGYIAHALETARHYAPRARLMLNDYSFEYDNHVEADRRKTFLRLVADLKGRGVPLDGVGLQAHLDLGKGPLKRPVIAPFMQALADMGLEIYITELDVKERDYRATPQTRDARVADEVARYLDIALDQKAVKGVTTWGLSDRHSWLRIERGDRIDRKRYGNPAPNRGLPYDAAMQPKPMHQALAQAFSGGLT
ncbi:MAG: glycosyl hydrolase family 10 [Hyphomicrobiales bacterium]|nr:MAG: glycosyl hydrolase family 10 [Hyphomicrobiales bacterium]